MKNTFKILVALMSLSFLNNAIASELHQIVIDTGATIQNQQEADKYRKAFLSMVFSKIRGRRDDRVVVVSGSTGKTTWTGTAQDFRKRRANLVTALDKMDFFESDTDHRSILITDVKAFYKKLQASELRYKPKLSNIYIFSPLLDTRHLLDDNMSYSEIIEANIQELPDLMRMENIPGKRNIHVFWATDELVETANKVFRDYGNTRSNVHSKVETLTLLDTFLPR